MAHQFPVEFPNGTAPTTKVQIELRGIHSIPRLLLAAMRPHQWLKNLFVFAPLLFGRRLGDFSAVGSAMAAFAVFSFLASGLYIFNDWIDREEDRCHPEKCLRPLSSGLLPVSIALAVAGCLVATAFIAAAFLGFQFFLIAAFYFVLTLGYCLAIKKIIILDCMTIAIGFVLRVVGGAAAVDVTASHWLIVCAFLLALFLAFTKRRQELLTLSQTAGEHRSVLAEYSPEYLGQVNNILIGAAIVCYALYTVAPETIQKFQTDKMIYGTIFVIYGLFRYLALIKSPKNGGNPSKMLARDKPLIFTVAGWVIYNSLMIYQLSLTELADFWKR